MKPLLSIALAMLILSGCQQGPTASMTRIATFEKEQQLRQLYDRHRAPLVIVGHGIYLPPDECLCKKPAQASSPPPASSAAEPSPPETTPTDSAHINTEDRKYGGLAEQRIIGGFAEQRVFGGGSLPIKCTARGDCRGFTVFIPLGGAVQYFDGTALIPAKDGFVPVHK